MRTMLLAVLALALAGCGGKTATPAATGDIAAWVGKENVAVVERQQLKIGPAISGTLEAERRAMVRAELGATVVQIQAEAGQTVSQGTVLARLDDAAIRDAYESSKAGVRSAELNAEIARRELERAQALVAAGAIADRDVETARLAETSAESQLAEARSRLAAAEKQLHRTVIRAPFGGVVSERPVSLGDVVQPGTILFTIVDPASLKFEGAVSTEELAGLKVGAAVEFTVAGIGVLEGRRG
jgi:RND family efflux transporter MFP subunit